MTEKQKKFGLNPFTVSLRIPVLSKHFNNEFKSEDKLVLPVIKEFEYLQFTKLYTDKNRRKILMGCSGNSLKLLIYIMQMISPGKDYIFLNKERYLNESGISLNTYKKNIIELIRYGLLSKTIEKNYYWINPDFFFKGNRLKAFPKNIELKYEL